MIDSLKIGRTIFQKLNTITELNGQIFPLIAENDTAFPFVIYSRSGFESEICKDGIYQDNVTMTIQVITDNYNDGIEIAQEARELLTFSIPTMRSRMIGASEEYANEAYIQTLEFLININN